MSTFRKLQKSSLLSCIKELLEPGENGGRGVKKYSGPDENLKDLRESKEESKDEKEFRWVR